MRKRLETKAVNGINGFLYSLQFFFASTNVMYETQNRRRPPILFFLPSSRVARYFLAQYTKTGKMYQIYTYICTYIKYKTDGSGGDSQLLALKQECQIFYRIPTLGKIYQKTPNTPTVPYGNNIYSKWP
jgi:hypothetical protein